MRRRLFEDEHELFRDSVRAFFNKEVAPHHEQWERDGIVPRSLFEAAGDLGILGMAIPTEYGGGGVADFRYNVVVAEEIQRAGVNAAGLGLTVHSDIIVPYFLRYSTDAQRARWLPGLASGALISAIAMTEPGIGSDLAGMATTAVLDGDHYVVNGSKTFITNGINADVVVTAVKTDPNLRHRGMSLLVVERGMDGFERGRNLDKVGMHAQDTSELFFTDVEVPAKNVVGAVNDGWRITMGSLAHERGGLWVQGVAMLDHLFRGLVAIARHTGKDRDPVTRRKLAAAYEMVSSLRSLGYKGFGTLQHTSSSPEHSYLKLATSEMGKALFEFGLELEGSAGVVLDKAFVPDAGRWVHGLFASFANTIAGGTSEIQRNIIAERVLGLPRG